MCASDCTSIVHKTSRNTQRGFGIENSLTFSFSAKQHSAVGDVLPVSLCQGYSLELAPSIASANACAAIQSQSTESAVRHRQHEAHSISQQGVNQEPPGPLTSRPDESCGALLTEAASWADTFPAQAPSIVGATYMAVQGSHRMAVGATKQYNLSPEEALKECGRQVTDPGEVQQAEKELRPKAEGLWSPASTWQVPLYQIPSLTTASHCFAQQAN